MTLQAPLTSLGAWTFSMIVHASALCGAILLAAEFSLVPRIAPFRWDVTLVAASRPESLTSDSHSPVSAPANWVTPVTDTHTLSSDTTAGLNRAPSASPSVVKLTAPAADNHMRPIPTFHRSVDAAIPVEDFQDGSSPPSELSPEDPSAETSTPPELLWSRPSSIASAEIPPPAVKALDESIMPTEPAVPEAPHLMSHPSPQFKPIPVSRQALPDYGWLASMVATEVEQIKRYPTQAKWHRWQGKVMVQAVIHKDGRISDIQVVESSGHDMLDHDAIALLERISPMQLQHPLDQSSIVVRIPIGYRLE